MKSSPSIWHYVLDVKSTVKISSIFVAFLENINFNPEGRNDVVFSSLVLTKINIGLKT